MLPYKYILYLKLIIIRVRLIIMKIILISILIIHLITSCITTNENNQIGKKGNNVLFIQKQIFLYLFNLPIPADLEAAQQSIIDLEGEF